MGTPIHMGEGLSGGLFYFKIWHIRMEEEEYSLGFFYPSALAASTIYDGSSSNILEIYIINTQAGCQ